MNSDNLQTNLKHLWIHGFLVGLGVVSVFFLIMVVIWDWPPVTPKRQKPNPTMSQTPMTPKTKPAPVIASVVRPPTPLKEELESVLGRMAEANRKKDLPLLMSLYDPTCPDLPGQTKETSGIWTHYDYHSLQFRIEEIKSHSPDNVSARVICKGKTRNRATREEKDFTQIYQIVFTNASGQWRIKYQKKP